MDSFYETNYLVLLIPCSESLAACGLSVMIKIVLCGSYVCYFAISSLCDVKSGCFYNMCCFQVYYVRCAHTHMLYLCRLPKLTF